MWSGALYVFVLLCVTLLIAVGCGLRLPEGALPVTGRRRMALLVILAVGGSVVMYVDLSQCLQLSPWLPLQALVMLIGLLPFLVAFLLIPASLLVLTVMTVMKTRESIIQRKRKPKPH